MMLKTSRIQVILITSILLIALIVSSLVAVETAFRTRQVYGQLQKLYTERNHLVVEWGRLLLEKAAVASDARLDRIAQDKLLMKIPSAKDTLLIERSL